MARRPTQGTDFLRLAVELGARVEAPFVVRHEGEPMEFAAHLPDFGGPKGMVLTIGDMRDFDALSEFARRAGLYFSSLNASASASVQSVKDTLDDWGFYGPPEQRPSWFTGRPWTTDERSAKGGSA